MITLWPGNWSWNPDSILMMRWEKDMEPWEGDICFRSRGLILMPQLTLLTLMTSPGMLTKLGATVSTNPWQLGSGSCMCPCFVSVFPELLIAASWILPYYYDTQHSGGEVLLWELVLSSSLLPNPLHHVSDIRIYINSPGGSRIMSLFLSQMSHLVHYEGHRMFVTRVIFVETTDHVCCPDWESCSNAPVFQVSSWSHSCLQMFLITPSVPSQLSSQNLWPRNRPRMLRERFRGDIRARTESICVFARTCFAMSSYSISMGHSGLRGDHTPG